MKFDPNNQPGIWFLNLYFQDVSRVENATKLMQNMLEKKFICHASGNQTVTFVNGHHFYFIVQNGPKPGWSPARDFNVHEF
jgi:hypothetical protein